MQYRLHEIRAHIFQFLKFDHTQFDKWFFNIFNSMSNEQRVSFAVFGGGNSGKTMLRKKFEEMHSDMKFVYYSEGKSNGDFKLDENIGYESRTRQLYTNQYIYGSLIVEDFKFNETYAHAVHKAGGQVYYIVRGETTIPPLPSYVKIINNNGTLDELYSHLVSPW